MSFLSITLLQLVLACGGSFLFVKIVYKDFPREISSPLTQKFLAGAGISLVAFVVSFLWEKQNLLENVSLLIAASAFSIAQVLPLVKNQFLRFFPEKEEDAGSLQGG